MLLQEEFDKVIAAYNDYIKGSKPKSSKDKINYLNTVFNSINMIIKLLALSSSGIDVDSGVFTAEQKAKRDAIGDRMFRTPVKKATKEIIAEISEVVKKETTAENKTKSNKEDMTMPTAKKPVAKKAASTTTTAKKKETAKKSTTKTTTAKKPDTNKTAATKAKSKARIEAEAKMKAIENIVAGKTAVDIISEELKAWGISTTGFTYTALAELPSLIHHAPTYDEVVNSISEHSKVSRATVSSAFTSLAKKADLSKSIYCFDLAHLPKELVNKTVIIEKLCEFCDDQ